MKRQKRVAPVQLGAFEEQVMLAVVRMGREAYGMNVRRELEEVTEREVTIGSVYATLDRLEAKGLISMRTARAEPGRRGRARRYCRLTPLGTAATRHSAVMLTRMMSGLRLLEGTRKPS